MALSRDEATVWQGSTPTYRAQIEQAVTRGHQVTHRPLPLLDIDTVVLNYQNAADDTYINGREAQDVKNANNVTITDTGFLIWELQAADTAITDTALESEDLERHTATFCVTTTSAHGGKVFYKVVDVFVKKR